MNGHSKALCVDVVINHYITLSLLLIALLNLAKAKYLLSQISAFFFPPFLGRNYKFSCLLKLKSKTKNEIKQMLLSKKLLCAFSILIQICTILVKYEFLTKPEIFIFIPEIYLSFMGAVLAPTRKFWHPRTTRRDIPLNQRPGYSPGAAHPVQMYEEM